MIRISRPRAMTETSITECLIVCVAMIAACIMMMHD